MAPEAMKYLAIAITMLAVMPSALGEAFVVSHSVDGIARNPESYKTLRTTMILGCSLVETTAIYALLIAILMLFVG
jgi:F-type H+-transporting ATPase subunit c